MAPWRFCRSAAREFAYWESAPDRGIYHAWNKALEHATGDWICFLGADDCFWSDDALARLAAHLPAPSAGARGVRAGRRDVAGGRSPALSRPALARRQSAGSPWSLTLPHPGLLHHRSLFAERAALTSCSGLPGIMNCCCAN